MVVAAAVFCQSPSPSPRVAEVVVAAAVVGPSPRVAEVVVAAAVVGSSPSPSPRVAQVVVAAQVLLWRIFLQGASSRRRCLVLGVGGRMHYRPTPNHRPNHHHHC